MVYVDRIKKYQPSRIEVSSKKAEVAENAEKHDGNNAEVAEKKKREIKKD